MRLRCRLRDRRRGKDGGLKSSHQDSDNHHVMTNALRLYEMSISAILAAVEAGCSRRIFSAISRGHSTSRKAIGVETESIWGGEARGRSSWRGVDGRPQFGLGEEIRRVNKGIYRSGLSGGLEIT